MPPEIFAALSATWPAAETVRLGPWTLRRATGAGNRASAATCDGQEGEIAEAEAAMRAWGQRPTFQLRPGEDALDALLAARGYRPGDRSIVYAAPAAALARPGGLAAIPCEGPLAAMAEIWAADGIGAERLAAMARAPRPRTWLLGRQDDHPAGCAFVAAAGGYAVLSALLVAPSARHKGLAARMMGAAAAWAAGIGVPTLALVVDASNAPARALYVRLGMDEVAAYHYRFAPEDAR